ncbi:uncharacterized protein PV09_05185 [Verruconis gallopava]|uniref:GST N-terminal domain-containing protein n=1 Tax=Verruconis gallopava TaxID=253628 RepID=A0A0D2A9Y6_9PEZI|nr:uncharacterized protein PV09_05185 [Verruconis gallopava]KIW03410.1 hypothetical protein PV09_05185 [Verruconis gallopava]
MSATKLVLYDNAVSSYAQKVRMALRYKHLPFESEAPEALGSGRPNPTFAAANVRMEVPVLIDGDFKVFDSTAILMYLEDKFTSDEHPSLFPSADPQSKAEARMIEEICDTHYEAINWAFGEINWFKRAEGEEAERLNAAIVDQTKQIQDWLTPRLGDKPFFSGEAVGYADIAVAPMLNRSVSNGLGPELGSPLQQWHARMEEIPCIKETWEEFRLAAPKMAALGPAAWEKGQGMKREYRDHRLEFLVKNGAIGIVQKGIEDDNIRFSWPHPSA